MTREEDIHFWQRKLVDAMEHASGSPNIRLQDLSVFFVRAAARALELRGHRASPSNDRHFNGRSNGSADPE
jgi:hypothetical protein